MKRFIKIICIMLALTCLLMSFVACDKNKDEEAIELTEEQKKTVAATIELAEAAYIEDVHNYIDSLETYYFKKSDEPTNYVMIDIADHGKVVVALRPDTAPISVENFKKLVSEKFYDGLIFHRVIKDFMIQGGGFTSEFKKTSANSIKGEFESNGVENNLLHLRGVLSMARTSVPDSASSQFFIMHQDSPHLDGDYAAFGYVIAGIEAVDSVANVKTGVNYQLYATDVPVENVVIKSAYFVSPITE